MIHCLAQPVVGYGLAQQRRGVEAVVRYAGIAARQLSRRDAAVMQVAEVSLDSHREPTVECGDGRGVAGCRRACCKGTGKGVRLVIRGIEPVRSGFGQQLHCQLRLRSGATALEPQRRFGGEADGVSGQRDEGDAGKSDGTHAFILGRPVRHAMTHRMNPSCSRSASLSASMEEPP